MATVHLARQIDLDRLVALKRLDGLAEESDGRVRRFVREARLAASLSHPNTVTVHDAFEVAGVPYIAMELVPGGTLRELLTGLTLGQVAGGIKITDFGIAKATSVAHGDDGPLTRPAWRSGRPAYMAPEQAARRSSSTTAKAARPGSTSAAEDLRTRSRLCRSCRRAGAPPASRTRSRCRRAGSAG
jgi:serine/threonine protein kinase